MPVVPEKLLTEPPFALKIVLLGIINYTITFHYRPGIFFTLFSFSQSHRFTFKSHVLTLKCHHSHDFFK